MSHSAVKSPLDELQLRTRGALAEASVMRRPLGPILQTATLGALRIEQERRARPSEIPRFFDDLTRYVQSLDPPKRAAPRRGRR